ncbi:DUF1894 domain-containing protein [Methanoplanus sp. FWC-SCC4]|uniref:DUF1894 domain-containing protein n=1 Tax=Methanochimaera problematica TaxID=2609417 RepID=A0AA97I205_9EURY|nr:DUF1894 domain-containing protein [Methanoplanus sp. FWC-SCC4]WOF15735.1 DUF1894 domain-containing protein [Methanoplanus sp. FWC-SCC4]
MGCLDKLPYEILLRNSSFSECREYIKKNFKEIYEVKPGYKIFDVYIIGVPPITIGVDGNDLVFPYTKPCHGTFLVKVASDEEAARLRKNKK